MKDLTSRLDQVNVLPQENRGNSSYSNFYSNAKKVVSNIYRGVGKAITPVLVSSALAIGLGVKEARAASILSFSDIVPKAGEGWAINYTSTDSSSSANQIVAICYIVDPIIGSVAVGGFDIKDGEVSKSYYNKDWNPTTFYGLNPRDTANTGANPGNTYQIYYEVFEDKDGDGKVGTYEGNMILDRSEALSSSQYSISNFTPYGIAIPGNFTFTQVPEPTSLSLFALGAAAIGLFRRRQSRK